jgi:UDPglucose 6-dehydrogenase
MHNVTIKAYDPKAMTNMQSKFPKIIYCNNAYDAATNADGLLILTEWEEFKKLDFSKIALIMNQKIIYDSRNILDIQLMKSLGFKIESLGRSTLCNFEVQIKNNIREKLY